MATLKEWQSPVSGKILARATDDALLINGDSFWSDVAYPAFIPQGSATVVPDDARYEWYHEQWGAGPSEGLVRVIADEQKMLNGGVSLFHELQIILPAGALVVAAQNKIMETGFAGGTTTASGLGIASNINKYCNAQNAPDLPNINPKPTPYPNGFTPLAAQETLRLTATTNAGTAGDTPWSSGRCRVRVVYDIALDLDRF